MWYWIVVVPQYIILAKVFLYCLPGQQEVNIVVKKLRAAFPLRAHKKGLPNSVAEGGDEDEKLDNNLIAAIKRVKKSKKKPSTTPLPAINLDE